jgi:hypothetical protein
VSVGGGQLRKRLTAANAKINAAGVLICGILFFLARTVVWCFFMAWLLGLYSQKDIS